MEFKIKEGMVSPDKIWVPDEVIDDFQSQGLRIELAGLDIDLVTVNFAVGLFGTEFEAKAVFTVDFGDLSSIYSWRDAIDFWLDYSDEGGDADTRSRLDAVRAMWA